MDRFYIERISLLNHGFGLRLVNMFFLNLYEDKHVLIKVCMTQSWEEELKKGIQKMFQKLQPWAEYNMMKFSRHKCKFKNKTTNNTHMNNWREFINNTCEKDMGFNWLEAQYESNVWCSCQNINVILDKNRVNFPEQKTSIPLHFEPVK
jgi:hypothetical protein